MSSFHSDKIVRPFRVLRESLTQTRPIYLPLFILSNFYAILSIGLSSFLPNSIINYKSPDFLSFVVSLAAILAYVLASTAALSIGIHFTYCYFKHQTINLRSSIRQGIRKTLPLLTGTVGYCILTAIGFIGIISPNIIGFVGLIVGLYIAVTLLFFNYAIVCNNCLVSESFSYSAKLVKGRWWTVFISLLIEIVCLAIFVNLTTKFTNNIAIGVFKCPQNIANTIIGPIVIACACPFVIAFFTKLYIRLQDTTIHNTSAY